MLLSFFSLVLIGNRYNCVHKIPKTAVCLKRECNAEIILSALLMKCLFQSELRLHYKDGSIALLNKQLHSYLISYEDMTTM